MSNSFGYLDIILLGMIAGLSSAKIFWEKLSRVKVYLPVEKIQYSKTDAEQLNKTLMF